jgi:hypothetical protein
MWAWLLPSFCSIILFSLSCDFVYGNYVPFGLDLGACLFLLLETVSYGQAFREGMDRLPRMCELRCAQLLGHACQLIRRRTLHWNHRTKSRTAWICYYWNWLFKWWWQFGIQLLLDFKNCLYSNLMYRCLTAQATF